MTGKLEYPLDRGIDLGHTALKVAVGFAPGGGAIAEVFNTFVPSQLSQRRDEWGRRVTDILNELIASGRLASNDLNHDPAFVDTLVESTLSAIKTSNSVKREALAQAVSSSARRVVEPDLQHMFVRLVDELTEMHLHLLGAYHVGRFSSAAGSGEDMENRFLSLVGNAFPALAGQRDLIVHLCNDLANRSLIAVPPKGPRSLGGINVNSMRITQSGTAFLDFIGLAK